MTDRPLVIVITGASRGLGAGMAKAFKKKGYKLGLCSRSASVSYDIASDNIHYQPVDVCNAEALQDFLDAVVAKFGDIDMWINNAGILGPIQPIRNTNFADYNKNIQINLGGVFHGSKAYIQHVRSSQMKDATLINISSGAAVAGYAGWGAYCSSKGAVDRLTECAFLEEKEATGKPNFRAYSIAPGVIDTDMQAMIRSTPKEHFPMLEKFQELKRNETFNSPEYVSAKIEELALLKGPQTLPVVQRIPNEKK